METVATSVRIAGNAIEVLSRLSGKLGQSKAQVIERALEELEERVFWGEVSAAFERIAAAPEDRAEVETETRVWETGTGRDMAGEEW